MIFSLKVTIVSAYITVILAMMNTSSLIIEANAQEIIGYSESRITVKSLDEEEGTDDVCGSSRFHLVDALAKDMKGNRIENGVIGSQVILEASIVSNCEISSYPIFVMFGFFQEDGGVLVAYQNFTLNPDDQVTIETSWTPESTGKYEMAVFLHGCLNCSGDFGIAERYNITIID